jgi:signal transduction histidine kinase
MVKWEDLKIIGRNAARLERLSSDILDVSRIESGSLRLNMEKFDINMFVNEAIDDAKRHIDIEDVKITCDGASNPLYVEADKDRMTQVLANLLNNAIRFTKPSGTVSIGVHSSESKVNVMVTDTGSGIPLDILPKLFTKFSSSLRSGSGTGLGLFISKAIIEAHGGMIWGTNNSDGKGATFGFEIPVEARQNPNEQMSSSVLEPTNSILVTLAKEAFEKS